MLLIVLISLFQQNFTQQISVTNISKEIGLSTGSVNKIVIDSNRFIWLSNFNRLYRYDGHQSILIDENSGLDGRIRTIQIGPKNTIWVSNNNGLQSISTLTCKVNPIYFNFNDHKINKLNINHLLFKNDTILFAINGRDELVRFNINNDKVTLVNRIKNLTGARILDISLDRDGTVLIASKMGLFKYVNGQIQTMFVDKLVDKKIKYIIPNQTNGLWFGTRGGDLYHYDKNQLNHHKIKVKHNNKITKGRFHSNGKIYLFSRMKLIIFNPKNKMQNSFDLIDRQKRIQYRSHHLDALIVDQVLFISTFRDGILKYNMKSDYFKNKFKFKDINNLFEDSRGNIWISERQKHLRIYSNIKKFKELDFEFLKKLRFKAITGITEDFNGNIWISLYSNKLIKIDIENDTFKMFKLGQSGLSTFGLFFLNSNKILLKTNHGLIPFNPRTESFEPDILTNYKKVRWVNDIIEDKNNNLWLGTNANGLFYLDLKNKKLFRFREEFFKEKYISDLMLSEKKELWVGTNGNGIFKIDKPMEYLHPVSKSTMELVSKNKSVRNGKVIRYSKANGLQNDHIVSILTDKNSRIWVGTYDGLSMINYQKNYIVNFNELDGIFHSELNKISAINTKEDFFLFGSRQGLLIFKPNRLKLNKIPPKPLITKIYLNNESVGTDRLVNLKYYENTISFEYSAMDYTNPAQNCYKTMLTNYQDEWSRCSESRVNYSNLDPGNYTFKLKASNNHNIWADNAISIKILISEPYWATFWFQSIIIIFVFSMLYTFYRFRINKVIALQRFRESLARDLHDEVGSTLVSIGYFARILEKRTKAKEEKEFLPIIDQIKRASLKSQESIRDISHALPYQKITWRSFISKLEDHLSALLTNTDINYKFKINPTIPDHQVSYKINFHLWLVNKEIIANAIKHAKCSKIEVRFKYSKSFLIMIFFDNGVGLKIENESNKIASGIRNIENRLKKINATLRVFSKIDKGTAYYIKLLI